MKKVIIAGGRDFNDRDLLEKEVTAFIQPWMPDVHIITGGASGADLFGNLFATEMNLSRQIITAKWGLHGKAAGPLRNSEMAEKADALIAFWDGKSKGTADMIKKAEAKGLTIKVIHY